MASWEDLERIAAALPELEAKDDSRGRSWSVRRKPVVWERPLRQRDYRDLGDAAPPPDAAIVGIRTDGEGGAMELIAARPDVFFTIPHFDGYPAVLAMLDRIDIDELAAVITEAWAVQAPRRLVERYRDGPETDD